MRRCSHHGCLKFWHEFLFHLGRWPCRWRINYDAHYSRCRCMGERDWNHIYCHRQWQLGERAYDYCDCSQLYARTHRRNRWPDTFLAYNGQSLCLDRWDFHRYSVRDCLGLSINMVLAILFRLEYTKETFYGWCSFFHGWTPTVCIKHANLVS